MCGERRERVHNRTTFTLRSRDTGSGTTILREACVKDLRAPEACQRRRPTRFASGMDYFWPSHMIVGIQTSPAVHTGACARPVLMLMLCVCVQSRAAPVCLGIWEVFGLVWGNTDAHDEAFCVHLMVLGWQPLSCPILFPSHSIPCPVPDDFLEIIWFNGM